MRAGIRGSESQRDGVSRFNGARPQVRFFQQPIYFADYARRDAIRVREPARRSLTSIRKADAPPVDRARGARSFSDSVRTQQTTKTTYSAAPRWNGSCVMQTSGHAERVQTDGCSRAPRRPPRPEQAK